MIDDSAIIGKHTIIPHPELVNIYGCTIGENCKIGAFIEIKHGVTIGNKVKIQAIAFIPEGGTIEDEVFNDTRVTFINDSYL